MANKTFPDEMSAAWYLAGMIDGEGTIATGGKNGIQSRQVSICGTEPDMLEAVKEAMDTLDFRYSVYIQSRRRKNQRHADRWDVVLRGGRESFERFYDLVPFQSTRKRSKLLGMIQSYRPRRPTRAALIRAYVDEQRSVKETAQELGISSGRVLYALKHYGIERRSVSEAVTLDWKKRKGGDNSD